MSGKKPKQVDPESKLDAIEEAGGGDAPYPETAGEEAGADSESGVEEPAAQVDALRREVESLTGELDELRDRHLRLAAEFDNFRKRTVRERAQDAQRSQGEVVRELLESLDDLERVSREGTGAEDAAALLEGVQLVERKLQRALERSGLARVESVGKPFDPEVHEALTTVPTEDPAEDGIVAQELAKGYLYNDILLRPALVQVKKYRARGDDAGDGNPAEPDIGS